MAAMPNVLNSIVWPNDRYTGPFDFLLRLDVSHDVKPVERETASQAVSSSFIASSF